MTNVKVAYQKLAQALKEQGVMIGAESYPNGVGIRIYLQDEKTGERLYWNEGKLGT